MAIIKSMQISHRFLNKDLLLHKYRKIQELRYHIPYIFSISDNKDLATIIAFAIGPDVNS